MRQLILEPCFVTWCKNLAGERNENRIAAGDIEQHSYRKYMELTQGKRLLALFCKTGRKVYKIEKLCTYPRCKARDNEYYMFQEYLHSQSHLNSKILYMY